MNIPRKKRITELHKIHYGRIFIMINTEKLQKGLFKWRITTPQIMPKLHSSTISQIKLKEFGKRPLVPSYRLPKNTKGPRLQKNTIGPQTSKEHHRAPNDFSTPIPQWLPYFTSMTFCQSNSPSIPYLHNHFPNKA